MNDAGAVDTDGTGEDDPRAPVENVLVLAPSIGDVVGEVTAGALDHTGDPTALLAVSLSGAPDRLLDTITAHAAVPPSRVATISVESTRGAATGVQGEPTDSRSVVVSSAGDLTGIGIRIDQCFTAWGRGTDVVLCFDSLTTLLQYADLPAVFRFCHAITHRTASLGGRSLFFLDPGTVDDRVVRTLESVFDRVEDRR